MFPLAEGKDRLGRGEETASFPPGRSRPVRGSTLWDRGARAPVSPGVGDREGLVHPEEGAETRTGMM